MDTRTLYAIQARNAEVYDTCKAVFDGVIEPGIYIINGRACRIYADGAYDDIDELSDYIN